MNIVLLSIILLYQVMMVVLDIKDMKKYKAIEITEHHKINFYKEAIIFGWIPVIIVFAFVSISSLSLNDIGFRAIILSENTGINILTGIISVIIVLALGYQTIMYFISADYRSQVMVEIEGKKENTSHYDKIISQLLIPKSKVEKKWFFFASLTAGICEEIIWRGCVIFLLSSIFPTINIIVIYAISCILFGLAHYYQGVSGMIKTGIVSIIFVMIYFTMNSIIPGILLHFLFDFSSAFLVKEERSMLA